MKKLRIWFSPILLWIASVGLVACTSLEVSTKYDPLTDFYGYKTFAWVPNENDRSCLAAANEMIWDKMKQELKVGFEERGFIFSDSTKPDFYIAFDVAVKPILSTATVEQFTYQPLWGKYGTRSLSAQYYNEGSLILDAIDAETNEMIWRGTVTGVVGEDPHEINEKIHEAVELLISYFPVWFDN
ncbi:hypothetical protein Ctha_1227 [Chloroherpeton thalassium ATCC 35110]|uniref:DUF4136 domain-containing protein n=2 Tax=Chloroherpeton thalassium TaxID=100716 RepID=B3QYZ7_CHLT3|nr:hypothetical protein Ctha_1227 [Chloroherpeton thalassium ATCC 35110]